jgi:ribosomal protein S18 acetylase RimI-like enzyme
LSQDCEHALAFLRADRLRHLVHLKYLHLYPDLMEVDCFESAVMLNHATECIVWDAAAYPQTERVFLPVAADRAGAEALLQGYRQRFSDVRQAVFKFCDEDSKAVFGGYFGGQMRQVKTLISFTTTRIPDDEVLDDVIVTGKPEAACLRLYESNGYSRDELDRYFADGGLSFTIYEDGMPVCSCLVYRNFDSVWEIGGLYTVEQARRKGCARRVTQKALAVLLERGDTPRYQVEESNLASVRLAESLGLEPCLRFEHHLVSR